MPIDVNSLKRKHGQNASNIPKKPPLTTSSPNKGDDSFFKEFDPAVVESDEELAKKRELISRLFDDNQELPMEEMLMYYFTQGEGKNMGKTVSPLKGIREGLEDMLNIQQLKDLIGGFKVMKKSTNNEEEEDNNMGGDNNNLMAMLPLFQKMQGGGEGGKFDPTMLLLSMAMGGQKNSNNNMGQLFLMMSMANMFAQQQPQQTQLSTTGQPIQGQPNINADMIKALWTELQNVMQQQQKPAIDPTTLIMLNAINKSSNNQGAASNQNIEIILDKMNTMMNNNQTDKMAMIMQQTNDKFERGMEMIAGALHREKPEEKMMQSWQFFKELTGDSRARSKDEMDFDLRREEIKLKEFARRDMLDREEKQSIREDAKSQRFMDIGGVVLDKIVGNGLGNLVGDLMSAKGTKGGQGKKAQSRPDMEFDPTLLDDL